MTQFGTVVPADSLRETQAILNPDPRTHNAETLAERHQRIGLYQLNESVPYSVRVHFETAKNLYLYAWFVYRFYPVAEKQALATLEFALRERLAPLFPDEFGSDAKRAPSLSTLFSRARKERLFVNEGLRANERLAQQRAEHRASMGRIREMEVRGLKEMTFDASPVEPSPEDYAHDSLKVFEQNLPRIRNAYAHGSAMLHPAVLGTFEIVTDLINQLFPSPMREQSEAT